MADFLKTNTYFKNNKRNRKFSFGNDLYAAYGNNGPLLKKFTH
jgi:hypothetical protein